jgi:hypothetical protein
MARSLWIATPASAITFIAALWMICSLVSSDMMVSFRWSYLGLSRQLD